MIKNMGMLDRAVRVVLALLVAVFYFTGAISGLAAIILGILAAIFLITGAIGTCPLYMPFKFSTKRSPKT